MSSDIFCIYIGQYDQHPDLLIKEIVKIWFSCDQNYFS